MNSSGAIPYGLESLTECICRASLLYQPSDVLEFSTQYVQELQSFKTSQSQTDPKIVCFKFQHKKEIEFFNESLTQSSDTTETPASPPPPLAEVEKAVEVQHADLAPCAEGEKVVTELQSDKETQTEPSAEEKKPTAETFCPTPPPRAGSQLREIISQPSPAVKGVRKPASPPSEARLKKRRVSSVRLPNQQQKEGMKETAEKCQFVLPPIKKKSSMPTDASASEHSAASTALKLPSIPESVTQKLVLPPIPQKKTTGGQVSEFQGKDVFPKSKTGSPMERRVVLEKAGRSPVQKTLGPKEEKPKPKTGRHPRPEGTKKSKEPKSVRAEGKKSNVQRPEWNYRPEKIPRRSFSFKTKPVEQPVAERTDFGRTVNLNTVGTDFVGWGTNNLSLGPCCLHHTSLFPGDSSLIIRYRLLQIRPHY